MKQEGKVRRASLYMRGMMFNPHAGTAQVVDTDVLDCTTREGRRHKRLVEKLLFRREAN